MTWWSAIVVGAGLGLAVVYFAPVRYFARVVASGEGAEAGLDWEAGLRWCGVLAVDMFGDVSKSGIGFRRVRLHMFGRTVLFPVGRERPGGQRRQKEERDRLSDPRSRAGASPFRVIHKRARALSDVVTALREKNFALLRRAWRCLHLKLRGRLRFGLNDPALLGIIHAGLFSLPLPLGLQLEADYTMVGLDGSLEGTGWFRPGEIAVLVVGAAFRPAVRRLWWPPWKGTA